MHHTRCDRIAEYRRQATSIRAVARQVSLDPVKQQLLKSAELLETRALEEERRACIAPSVETEHTQNTIR